jgi:hypothetical protein
MKRKQAVLRSAFPLDALLSRYLTSLSCPSVERSPLRHLFLPDLFHSHLIQARTTNSTYSRSIPSRQSTRARPDTSALDMVRGCSQKHVRLVQVGVRGDLVGIGQGGEGGERKGRARAARADNGQSCFVGQLSSRRHSKCWLSTSYLRLIELGETTGCVRLCE